MWYGLQMTSGRVQISPLVRSVSTDEGAVLLQLDRGMYRSLNAVGRSIWSAIGDGASVDDIVSRLCARYSSVPRDQIAADVETFISNLQARGLVVVEP
jgi:hypothetical protein